VGGRIKTYLLEKSRVVAAGVGERSFHMFYFMLKGCDPDLKQKLFLRNPSFFRYLNRTGMYAPVDFGPEGAEFKSIDETDHYETQNFIEARDAMLEMGISQHQLEEVFATLSAILWLGQIDFKPEGEGSSISPESQEAVEVVSHLLQVDPLQLGNSFIKRESLVSAKEKVARLLNVQEAQYTRDSFVKTVYQRLFLWIVKRVNEAIEPGNKFAHGRTIGVLDIYGFEIFDLNSFEQFCINYVK
jgi:myosin heavy subunit